MAASHDESVSIGSGSGAAPLSPTPAFALPGAKPPKVLEVRRPSPGQIPVTGLLSAGAARVDITPGFRTALAGWGPSVPPRRMRAVAGRLFSRVLVIDDGRGERVALMAVELHAGSRYLAERVAERTAPLGLHVGRLFLAGTHTHSGPGNIYGSAFYDAFAQSGAGLDLTLGEFLASRIAQAVAGACAALRPARVGHGLARFWGGSRNRSPRAFEANFPGLDAAAIRRQGLALGEVAETESGLSADRVYVDPRVQVMWAEEAAPPHRPIGGFATFGMHASLLAMEHPIGSADTFGVAARTAELLLRRMQPGSEPVIGLVAGAIGDVDPGPAGLDVPSLLRERKDRSRNLALVERLGTALGGQLVEACVQARASARPSLELTTLFAEPTIRDAVLSNGARMSSYALVGAPTLGGSELGGGAPCFEEGDRDAVPGADPQWPKAPPKILVRLIQEQLKYHPPAMPLRLVRLGEHWLLGLPGEPTSWLAHRLALELRAGGARQVLVAGVCGDYNGYLTTEREYLAQHYEGSSTLWGRHTEQWLLEQLRALTAGRSSSLPTGVARFSIREGKHHELGLPKPPSAEATPVWPRVPLFDEPTQCGGRLRLNGRWFAWAPQEQPELGWGPWIQLEDAATGQVVRSDGVPVDDAHHPFHLEVIDGASLLEWRWSVTLSDWDRLRGCLLRARTVGPRGVAVRPPQGRHWPTRRIGSSLEERCS